MVRGVERTVKIDFGVLEIGQADYPQIVAFTEKHEKDDIDRLVVFLSENTTG